MILPFALSFASADDKEASRWPQPRPTWSGPCSDDCCGCLSGLLGLSLATFGIVSEGTGLLMSAAVVFFLVLGTMRLGRWLEYRGSKAQRADGQPATPDHLIRYIVMVCVFGLAVWTLAKSAGQSLVPGPRQKHWPVKDQRSCLTKGPGGDFIVLAWFFRLVAALTPASGLAAGHTSTRTTYRGTTGPARRA